ncbi:MAG: hypothetical protein J0H92_15795 [Sphingobacteriales bacterium]|jgi:hypothetical protein|nr:hypothetical protein [Sphingobacteriales bacterium]NCT75555.1 hypothetical protein [Chitinophagaceae bacterium]OJW30677.1 MAG: hypothetical protein BGO54_22390 [Sphingobacteriales bacterium 46-32]
MTPAARFYFIICACLLLPLGSIVAQPVYKPAKDSVVKAKPYKLLTAGKQITIRSNTTNILSVMVWTSGGHRVLEQKDINAASYQFRISVNASAYFMMIRMADGKSYSEKIGVAL